MKIVRDLERNIVGMLLLIAGFVWMADAAIDAYVFGDGSFLDLAFFRVTSHEFYVRLFFIAVYSVTTVILVKSAGKSTRTQTELQKHLAAVENSIDGIAIFNANHEYLYVNESYARINGYNSPPNLIGKDFRMIYDEQQLAWMEQNLFPALQKAGRWRGELTAHRKDGRTYDQEASVTRLDDGGCVCVMRDITARKRSEKILRSSERFLSSIFESIHDPFCIIDRNYTIVRANSAYARLKNRAVDDLIDRTCFSVLEGKTEICDGCIVRKTLQSSESCSKEKKITLTNGDTTWIEIYTYPLFDESGQLTHVIEYSRDVTDRKSSEDDRRRLIERLEYLSKVDGLTGLLNRRALTEQLEYEIDRAKRYGSELAIILCDLDRLKEINDTYGHLAGDTTLQIVSAALRNSLRSADIAGRYGGDEFLVIVPQTSIAGASSIAEKIRNAVQMTEVRIDDHKRVSISLSIGVASLNIPSESIDAFVSRVDAALYASKKSGRNRITTAS
jgi:diguanylate cyclase (GGDEF)-like protein/PAS domain S-box-containing protein